MKRSVSRLSEKLYDVAVIGGGIYGACVARDAALRGLAVALVEQGDFGAATSSNSHRIAHGGFRYLQHADFKRMRQSIRERSTLMRIAPHLVFSMPVLIPTYAGSLPGRTLMALALKLNDVIAFDRNRKLPAEKQFPPGRILSRDECLKYCPGLPKQDLNGAGLFFDGQVRDTERLILSLLLSAARDGAAVVNYARAIRFQKKARALMGMSVEDLVSGKSVEVKAKVFVNCSGPWTDRVFELADVVPRRTRKRWIKAALILTRQLIPDVAVGIRSHSSDKAADVTLDKAGRYLFITPWKNHSLIGTFELPYNGDPDEFRLPESELRSFMDQINLAYPPARLTRRDVLLTYGGYVPAGEKNGSAGDQPAQQYQIVDHSRHDGVDGLISVVGVKFTTARDVAEKAVDLVETKLGRPRVDSRSALVPVYGGAMESFNGFLQAELQKNTRRVSRETIRHLIQTYGSKYREVLRYCDEDPALSKPVATASPVIRAEIVHAIREEMARTLDDILYRRTELGMTAYADPACLKSCAEIMAHELGSDGPPEKVNAATGR